MSPVSPAVLGVVLNAVAAGRLPRRDSSSRVVLAGQDVTCAVDWCLHPAHRLIAGFVVTDASGRRFEWRLTDAGRHRARLAVSR